MMYGDPLPGRTAPDHLSVRWTPPNARPRKFVFERRAAGGWTRTERVWTGEVWRFAGSEIVSDLEVEGQAPTASHTGP